MRKIIFWIGLFLIVSNTSCAFAKLAQKKPKEKKSEPVAEKQDEKPSHSKPPASAHDEKASPSQNPSQNQSIEKQNEEVGHEKSPLPLHDEEPSHSKSSSASHGGHWSYNGATGPNKWGHLDPEYRACSSGREQSPINITHAKTKDIGNIRFYYKPSKLNILNNGHTIQVDYDKGSSIRIDGERYDLLQFHFHTPSEHTIEGSSYPMELHLVHKSKEGKLAVVGVMMVVGKHNSLFNSLWENFPSKKGTEHEHFKEKIDMASILPAGERTFRYSGSLTTPPCSEGVKWNVLLSPISISNEQLIAFRDIFKKNNRPVQKLWKRTLWEDTTP
jgi:carbonic anhydrase